MNLLSIFTVFAMTSSPMPAENYYSWISPEIADTIQECVINAEYHAHLDFNGDGELNMADVVGVRKRYQDNCKYGNTITLDNDTVEAIVAENYNESLIYWEVYRVGNNNCRQYEVSVSETTEIYLWVEFENYGETIKVMADPFTESITVID
jgi:hypothetical protein